MSLFFEAIKIVDGNVMNPGYHIRRFNFTRQSFFPEIPFIDLSGWLKVPEKCRTGIVRCMIIYGEEIENIEFESYEMQPVKTLKLVYDNDIEYGFKYKNRSAISDLMERKGNHDDIIMVKNNRITDSSGSNIIFLSKGIWYTPKYPLLKGTKREKLLSGSSIIEKDIHVEDIHQFEEVGLINAMIELEDCHLKINQISL
jgi:4-amino-4-deoxychorismate lyase